MAAGLADGAGASAPAYQVYGPVVFDGLSESLRWLLVISGVFFHLDVRWQSSSRELGTEQIGSIMLAVIGAMLAVVGERPGDAVPRPGADLDPHLHAAVRGPPATAIPLKPPPSISFSEHHVVGRAAVRPELRVRAGRHNHADRLGCTFTASAIGMLSLGDSPLAALGPRH